MGSYTDTFITVAADCPASRGVVPKGRGERKSIAQIQYELLAAHPYRYTQADLIFEVHVRHKGVPAAEVAARGAEIRAELLAKPHPCLRASPLPKTYGWGVHYDGAGRIAVVAVESDAYRTFERAEGGATVVPAMRNRRDVAEAR